MADGDNSWSGSEEEQSGPGGRLGDGYETTAGSSGHTGAESGPHPTTEFRACYLLTSLSETAGGQTYIGYTNDPRRRLRQHNGEIAGGAKKTKSKRPWDMVLLVYGFTTEVSALQFEWHWTHPTQSSHLKGHVPATRALGGKMRHHPRSKTKALPTVFAVLYEMLSLPPFARLPLKVNFFDPLHHSELTSLAGLPPLPRHMRVAIGSMAQLYCYISKRFIHASDLELTPGERAEAAAERAAAAAASPLARSRLAAAAPEVPCHGCDAASSAQELAECVSPECGATYHLACLARASLARDPGELLPTHAVCPACGMTTLWGDFVRAHLLLGGG
ncbi:structure-specific endonuclease SLX1 [Thecamonas trahens ATCC 50062]|uniref:Structure-specific endonuclease subunit SLX1 homolog n=1 Tax=Thecamonas trahens ATCC 50062 TaxID=461836 RepID=A0A0L0DK78_THETB|nr:structure-specific endonuclease SLX1 [Thecamonas trahens ATCC 50062]KNC52687.1 structure-specific endonuclease SLX1 [Thecamonas trahens ATCC 50062]|eukprot:XP_013755231.1 structure-specific endonuclease SLX1 [Thecamonas trahens ATCC 50062]